MMTFIKKILYDPNNKVIVRAVPQYDYGGMFENYLIQYKIDPQELNWFLRIFANKWKKIPVCIYDELYPLTIDKEDKFPQYKQKFKTIQDILDYASVEVYKYEEKRKEINELFRKRNILY